VLSLADVQLENGYTKIANKILEHLALTKLSPTQFRLILVIWRYTYGFNRKDHEMSLSFLAKATGIHKQRIKQELDKLIENNIVIVTEEGSFSKSRKLAFNKDYDTWCLQSAKDSTVSEIADTTVSKNADSTVSETAYQEINNINKNLNKDDDISKPNPFVEFENAFGYLPPPTLMDEFNYWIDKSQFIEPEAIICEVIKRARLQLPRNPSSYVSKILKDLHNLGLFTLDSVKEYNQKFDQKTKQRTGKSKVVVTEKHGRDIPDDFVFDINAGEDWP
jgi:phage replication O-like protein O